MDVKETFEEQPCSEQSLDTSPAAAVDQASRLLMCLGNTPKPRLTLAEICEKIGIQKSRGHSILETLMRFGFVEKEPDQKTWRLGTGLLFLARNVLGNLDLRHIAAPYLARLSRETESTALLGAISDNHVFVVAKEEDHRAIGVTIRLGHRFRITYGAIGKSIMAFLPKQDRERIMATQPHLFYGLQERADLKRLAGELEACRKSGFAKDAGELRQGINAVSSPVFDYDNRIVGCVILVGTFSPERMDRFGENAVAAAKRISRKLGADLCRFPD